MIGAFFVWGLVPEYLVKGIYFVCLLWKHFSLDVCFCLLPCSQTWETILDSELHLAFPNPAYASFFSTPTPTLLPSPPFPPLPQAASASFTYPYPASASSFTYPNPASTFSTYPNTASTSNARITKTFGENQESISLYAVRFNVWFVC